MGVALVPDRTVRVEFSGEYDIARTSELRHGLLDIDLRGPEVVADLSAVTFIDSAALRAVSRFAGAWASEGGTLTLCNVPKPIELLLDITGTRDLFNITRAET